MRTLEKRLLANRASVASDLNHIAQKIANQMPHPGELLLLGIHGKGVWVAEHLSRLLETIWKAPVPIGTLDVGMHRDDLGLHPLPHLQPTHLPSSITGKTIILVDDVIQSGRTIRAALDSLHDFGRPDRVLLAVLIDRGWRRLPIDPDYIGRKIEIEKGERIELAAMKDGFELHIHAA